MSGVRRDRRERPEHRAPARVHSVMSGLEVLIVSGADRVSTIGRPEFASAVLGFLSKWSHAVRE
jgi:hypothetical protein